VKEVAASFGISCLSFVTDHAFVFADDTVFDALADTIAISNYVVQAHIDLIAIWKSYCYRTW
jgi:hypothetical protein